MDEPPGVGAAPGYFHERVASLVEMCADTEPDPDREAQYRAWAAEDRRKAVLLRAGAKPQRLPTRVARVSTRNRARESRPRRARTAARGSPSSSEPEPPPDLVRLAAASTRLWAHVRRREARQRLASA
jgi:hypothetical protein